MDGKPQLDYQAAAEAMLTALCVRARRWPDRHLRGSALSARYLALAIFPPDLRRTWSHESRRRRVREVAEVLRHILFDRQDTVQLLADSSRGYWVSGDVADMARYAARRRRQGLVALKAASDTKTAMAPAKGQQTLFPCGPAGPHRYRVD